MVRHQHCLDWTTAAATAIVSLINAPLLFVLLFGYSNLACTSARQEQETDEEYALRIRAEAMEVNRRRDAEHRRRAEAREAYKEDLVSLMQRREDERREVCGRKLFSPLARAAVLLGFCAFCFVLFLLFLATFLNVVLTAGFFVTEIATRA